jgi:hypothetical protein
MGTERKRREKETMDTELEITSVGHMMTQESFAVHDSA